MLKMFIIVAAFGHVYGYAGPLDYAEWKCPYVLAVAKQRIEDAVTTKHIEFHGRVVKNTDVTATCVMAEKRPAGKRLPV